MKDGREGFHAPAIELVPELEPDEAETVPPSLEPELADPDEAETVPLPLEPELNDPDEAELVPLSLDPAVESDPDMPVPWFDPVVGLPMLLLTPPSAPTLGEPVLPDVGVLDELALPDTVDPPTPPEPPPFPPPHPIGSAVSA